MLLLVSDPAQAASTRKERRFIKEGNELYRAQKFADAKVKYRGALLENDSSAVARFNLGLCDVKLALVNKDNDSISKKLMSEAVESLSGVARLGRKNIALSSKAFYNLGNLQFDSQNFDGAISMYKNALRLDPGFADARKNLRIAQLKRQNQNEDQKNDKENKEDKKDQQKEQEEKENQQDQQDQQQDRQQDQQKQQPPKQNELSPQAAEQILNAVENNERHALRGNNNGEKAQGGSGSMRKW